MKIVYQNQVFKIRNDHRYVPAILALTRTAPFDDDGSSPIPERNDIKQLWRELKLSHRRFLYTIARHPTGIAQSDLEKSLGLTWEGLRGVHNGLARIADRLGLDKPVSVVGYNSENRTYHMTPDIAATVKTLNAKLRSRE